MLDAKRHAELVVDIATNGQRETIKLYRGTVLDGRNRLKACQELGLTPKTATLPDDTDPWAYVWSLNGARRDLVDEQRYLIWADVAEHSAEWQAAQQAIRDEANAKIRQAAMAGEVGRASTKKNDDTLEVGHSVLLLNEKKEEPGQQPTRWGNYGGGTVCSPTRQQTDPAFHGSRQQDKQGRRRTW